MKKLRKRTLRTAFSLVALCVFTIRRILHIFRLFYSFGLNPSSKTADGPAAANYHVSSNFPTAISYPNQLKFPFVAEITSSRVPIHHLF